MSGLNLMGNARGGVKVSMGSGFSSSPRPQTASQAAFGTQTDSGMPSTTAALTPNDPFGVAFWGGVVALGLLLLVRHSLPA